MLVANENIVERKIFTSQVAVRQENELDLLLEQLSPETSWGERREAARRIGMLRNPEALPVFARWARWSGQEGGVPHG